MAGLAVMDNWSSSPSSEEEEEEEEELKRLKGVLEKKHGLASKPAKEDEEEKREKADWEQVYSVEEKMLKSRTLHTQGGYAEWEKEHSSWELQNGLVPVSEPEKRTTVRFYKAALERSLEDQKKQEEDYFNKLHEFRTKILTEEEKKIKQTYLEKREKWELGLCKEKFNPYGPEWELVYYTEKPELTTVELPPSQEGRQKLLPPPPEVLQDFCRQCEPPRLLSKEEERQKRKEDRGIMLAQGRCLDGSYLTPYCKCNRKFYEFDTALEGRPPEFLPLWLAYCRQFRQSHCFDIDDYIGGGGVWPLEPYNDFEGNAEQMMERANLAIQDYNEKECNVFKYKVLKIEKVNHSAVTHMYWMTVKVLNLTLRTPIETFQIHAGTTISHLDKVIFCCRPKEEAIIGLPSCEFCFGLLPERCVVEGKEP